MKTNLFLFLILFLFNINFVHAQRRSIVIGSALNFPSGNASNISGIGAGLSLKGEFGISPKYALTTSGSVLGFLGKRYLGPRTPTLYYVPVKAGLKYYTSDDFYLEGQIGASLPLNGNVKSVFIWSPGVGTTLNIRNHQNQIDLGLRYEGWLNTNVLNKDITKNTTFGFFGLSAGYSFGL